MRSKTISKIIGFFIVVLIFYFLGKNLYLNWEQVKEYQISLNYLYLIVSFILLSIAILGRGLVWKKIVDILEPANDLGFLESVRISVFSQFGKYLPGKIFAPAGMIYLTRSKNISKKNLYLSVIFDAFFPIISAFILSLLLIGLFFNYEVGFFNFYLIGFLAILVGFAITHPWIFQYLVKMFLKILKKEQVDFNFTFSWFNRIKIISFYSLTHFLIGLGFFFLINSITYFPLENLLSSAGIYILAGVLGLVAFFIPGGLGVREGVLVLFLQFYFPLNVAILISLLARIWSTLVDIFLGGGLFLYNKIKKQ
ncbi:MAG: lysylphosphatidylglycerol synthase domain-containing protein [Candidatus Nealsonbacteria bacterium]